MSRGRRRPDNDTLDIYLGDLTRRLCTVSPVVNVHRTATQEPDGRRRRRQMIRSRKTQASRVAACVVAPPSFPLSSHASLSLSAANPSTPALLPLRSIAQCCHCRLLRRRTSTYHVKQRRWRRYNLVFEALYFFDSQNDGDSLHMWQLSTCHGKVDR